MIETRPGGGVDTVGAVFDNNIKRKQKEDGANEEDAPLRYFLRLIGRNSW